ncbi:MAG: hypothetical protein NWE75_05545 [Candidatus Bathyarchaeota archaeon]|nr:hypothetical protein [Candidatus Bathyarchaeota archaeon]
MSQEPTGNIEGYEEYAPDYEELLEQPLNAEEATLLVIYFLQRMRKRIVTPRRAVLNDDKVFVIDVDLSEATATVQIHSETREILEYTIQPVQKEPKPLPISPRRIALILGAVVATVIAVMLFNFYTVFYDYIVSAVNTDYLIIAGAVILVAGIVIWWRRRG